MTDDLISRQAAIKQILLCENHDMEHDFEFNEGLIVAMNAVEELPTAEKRGKWIPLSDGWAECSSCEHLERAAGLMWRYCPNCGARMEGGDAT